MVPCGPWEGMTDTIEPQTARPNRAQLLRNCYSTTTDVGVAVVGVPGFELVGTQQGGSGARASQWVGQFNTTNGTKRSLWIINGQIVEYSHGSNTFTVRISAANLSGASITLSASARVYCTVFNDVLVVSDGVNTPFYWDGTSGGGLTKMTNCPVIYGQPAVYYAKLFVRKAAEPDTIVWSEEGDANLGYEAGGYSNAWNLGGTYAEPLHALIATNEFLGVVRPRSTTAIYGAVNDEFKSTGTRNAVSERIGTVSPGGTLVTDEGTFILDSDGRPQFWAKGGGYISDPPLWADCETNVRNIPRTALANVEMLADDTAGLIWVGLPESGQTYPTLWLLYERAARPSLVGVAGDFTSQRTGVWEDANGVRRVVHTGVDDGYCYLHGTPDGNVWDRGFASGTLTQDHTLTFVVPTADTVQDQYFDRLTLESSSDQDMDLTVDTQTPEGLSDAIVFTVAGSGSGLMWDVGNWDDEDWAGTAINQKADCNLHVRGRWAVVRVRHGSLGVPFNITRALIETFVDGREPMVA
jgi:hypothetical protein